MTHEDILLLLKRANGEVVSSATICQKFGVTRAAVWKRVEVLRNLGYEISAQTRHGYRLQSAPDLPLSAEVTPFLKTKRLGRELHYLLETHSTNRDAAKLAREGAVEGLTVVAEYQRGGRGRMARSWFSPPGVNLHASVVLRPAIEPGRAATLPLLAGVALAKAFESAADGVEARVKWPNDILIGGKKVCGILCEMHAENSLVRQIIMGFGVNVNLTEDMMPPEIVARAGSLRIASGTKIARNKLLATIFNYFEPLYDHWVATGFQAVLPEFKRYDALYGAQIVLEQGGAHLSGRAKGVAPDGALRLEQPTGEILIYSGEAHLLQYGAS